jgi:hypothetical protein
MFATILASRFVGIIILKTRFIHILDAAKSEFSGRTNI